MLHVKLGVRIEKMHCFESSIKKIRGQLQKKNKNQTICAYLIGIVAFKY